MALHPGSGGDAELQALRPDGRDAVTAGPTAQSLDGSREHSQVAESVSAVALATQPSIGRGICTEPNGTQPAVQRTLRR